MSSLSGTTERGRGMVRGCVRRLGAVAAAASVALVAGAGSAAAVDSPATGVPSYPSGASVEAIPVTLDTAVFGDGVRLRRAPGTQHPARGQLYLDDGLMVTECRGQWAHVRLSQPSAGGLPDGTVGWVVSRYVLPWPVPELALAMPPGC
ncbi:SH3 domain-containing protein [Streptomyces albus]|uniref:SH3 domain-containing protein n=1 Tax=Streptomyces albus TaxID=1888 RepID=UPI0033E15E59